MRAACRRAAEAATWPAYHRGCRPAARAACGEPGREPPPRRPHLPPGLAPRRPDPAPSTACARRSAARGHEVTVFTTDVHGDGRLDVPLARRSAIDGVEVRYFPVRSPRRLYRSPGLGAAARRGGRALRRRPSPLGLPLAHLRRGARRRAGRRALRALAAGDAGAGADPRAGALAQARLAAPRRAPHARAGGGAPRHERASKPTDAARLGLPLPPVAVVPNGIDPEPWDGDLAALSPAVRGLARGPPVPPLPGPALLEEGARPADPRPGRRPRRAPRRRRQRRGGDPARRWSGWPGAGVADRVRFLGPVHGADKAALLHRAAALVLPSRSENFGNVVLEVLGGGAAGGRHPRGGPGGDGPRDRRGDRRWTAISGRPCAICSPIPRGSTRWAGAARRWSASASAGRRWRGRWKGCTRRIAA